MGKQEQGSGKDMPEGKEKRKAKDNYGRQRAREGKKGNDHRREGEDEIGGDRERERVGRRHGVERPEVERGRTSYPGEAGEEQRRKGGEGEGKNREQDSKDEEPTEQEGRKERGRGLDVGEGLIGRLKGDRKGVKRNPPPRDSWVRQRGRHKGATPRHSRGHGTCSGLSAC